MLKRSSFKSLIALLLLFGVGGIFLLTRVYLNQIRPRHLSGSCKDCNIVIIDSDLLRADALDCKKSQNSTPNICSYASSAVHFKNNISHAVTTRPSFISTFTSLYPRSHTIWTPFEDRLNSSIITLTDILGAHSYKTISAAKFKTPQINWDWFDEFIDYSQVRNNLHDFKSGRQPFLLYIYLEDLHLPYILTQEDIQNLGDIASPTEIPRTREEFNSLVGDYLVEHYKEVFKPELIDLHPEIFQEDLSKKKHELTELFDTYGSYINLQKYLYDSWPVFKSVFMQFIDEDNPEHIDYLKARYLTVLKRIDSELAGIFELLNDSKLRRKTIVIIKSDHGEAFFEHGVIGHTNKLYQEVIHTPLFFKIPGADPIETDKFTQDIDIMPTLLDLLGLELPAQLQGESLIPLIENTNSSIRDYQIAQKGKDWIVSFRKNDLKIIIENSEVTELYNLASDPGETKNLLNSGENYEKIARALLEAYNQIIKNQVVYPNPKSSFPAWMDEGKRERLKKEGYF